MVRQGMDVSWRVNMVLGDQALCKIDPCAEAIKEAKAAKEEVRRNAWIWVILMLKR